MVFMLAPLSMTNIEYQLWRNDIPYAQQVIDELDYEEFNDTRLMPSLAPAVCAFPLLIHFHFFSFALPHMMMFKWDTYIRLALLLVLLLTLPTYPRRSMPVVLNTSLRSVRWDVTQMLLVTLFPEVT